MPTPHHAAIEQRAYTIWESENRPLGQALDHWLRAEAELQAEKTPRTSRATATKPRATAAKPRATTVKRKS
jgi:hypothetical protein